MCGSNRTSLQDTVDISLSHSLSLSLSLSQPLCDNHDDGETQALILCDHCGNLCGECDRVLHYSKKNKDHQRQVRYHVTNVRGAF